MRKPLPSVVMGVAAVSLLTIPLWRSDRLHAASAPASPAVDSARLCPLLRSPARQALRESACWIAQANQRASDAADASCQALEEWDPAVWCDRSEARQQQLAADPGGHLQEARRALERAAALATTPEERRRIAVTRAALAPAADPGIRGAIPLRGE
jgi:signal transduction histidine kinase